MQEYCLSLKIIPSLYWHVDYAGNFVVNFKEPFDYNNYFELLRYL